MNKTRQSGLGHHVVLSEAHTVLRERLCSRAAGTAGARREGKSAADG